MIQSFWRSPFAEDIRRVWPLKTQIFMICLFDARSRYVRTFLGPFWPIIAVAFGSVGIALVWGSLFGLDLKNVLPHITTGFIVWIYVSGTITSGTSCFYGQTATMLSQKLPLSFYPLILVIGNSINFIKSLLIVVFIQIFFPAENFFTIFLFPFYFLLAFLNLTLLVYLIGFLGTRYRDIEILINSMMPLVFFISPIVFKADMIPPAVSWIIYVNPLSSLLVILRDPLIGVEPDIVFIYCQLILLVLTSTVLYVLFNKKYKNLPFWL